MKLGAALLLCAYLGAVVVAVGGARGKPADRTQCVGWPRAGEVCYAVTQDPVTQERESESWHTRYAEMRRLAYRRLKVIRNQRAILNRRFAYQPGHWLEQAFLCIHRYEGRWADTRPPYWGGLQLDGSFQQTYGGAYWRYLGTADTWPPSVQIAVAIKAWFTRGFRPWPNTARRCGLL